MLNIMNKVVLGKFVVAALLIIVAVGLVATKKDQLTSKISTATTAQAQISSTEATPYESEWTAKEILAVNAGSGLGEVGIGPSKWEVRGKIGDDRFIETWTTPGVPTFTVTNPSGGTKGNIGIDNQTDWLVGYKLMPSGSTAYAGVADALSKKVLGDIDSKSPSPITDGLNAGFFERVNAGKGSSCKSAQGSFKVECVDATGAYGWSKSFYFLATNYDTNEGESRINYMNGVALPLKWSVAGTYCPAGDTATCQ